MTKKDIVKQIADETGQPQLKIKQIVQLTLDSIVDSLVKNGRIELRKFGVFEVKRRKARRARNPRTGVPVMVEPKNVVTFQPGKEMEDKVRRLTKASDAKKKLKRPRAVAASARPSANHHAVAVS